MNPTASIRFACALLLVAASVAAQPATAEAPSPDDGAVFVENRGQWPSHVRFAARTGPLSVWFDDDGMLLTLEGEAGRVDDVRLSFAGEARLGRGATFTGLTPRRERRHYLLGDDPSRWVLDAPTYDALVVRDLYDGVDLVVRDAGGRVEYDLRVDRGVSLDRVVIDVDGARGVRVDGAGALVLETATGDIVQPAPVSWHALPGGARDPVASGFALRGARSFGFSAPTRSRALPLVVDPVFEWSSYLGGGNNDLVLGMDATSDGGVILAGTTKSSDFPTTSGTVDLVVNARDGFVTKFAADGTTVDWSTVIGGGGAEEVRAVAVGADGSIGLAGYTASSNFPRTIDAFDPTFDGGTTGGANLNSDAFATRLSSDGTSLLASTYLGGEADDIAMAVAIADDGALVVGGKTSSTAWPTSEGAAFDAFLGGSINGGDGFIARVSADGQTLEASSYVPGTGDELVAAVAIGPLGELVAAGWTSSPGFVTTPGAHDETYAGTSDGYVLRLSPDATSLEAATFLGGSGDDAIGALRLDGDGRAVVVGNTHSADLPVTETAPDAQYGGGTFFGDGLVAILSADLSTLDYATYLGGSGDDILRDVALDGAGRPVVVGYTFSSDLPVTVDALDTTLGGQSDALVFVLDTAAGVFLYGSYVGGAGSEQGEDVVIQPETNLAVIGGATFSDDFPIVGDVPDGEFSGFPGWVSDAFVSAFSLDLVAPQGEAVSDWSSIGYSHGGGLGDAPELVGLGLVQPGAEGTLALSGGPAYRTGILLVGLEESPQPFKGGTLAFEPTAVSVLFMTDADGATDFGYVWNEDAPQGTEILVQGWVTDPAAAEGYCGSNAIKGVIAVPDVED